MSARIIELRPSRPKPPTYLPATVLLEEVAHEDCLSVDTVLTRLLAGLGANFV